MISSRPFGVLPDGRQATLYTLERGGLRAQISDFGGVLVALYAPDRHGVMGDVVLGFDSVTPYLADADYFGALVGRYANRIAGGSYVCDGVRHQLPLNDGPNQLHGGPDGWHRRLWQATVEDARLVLRLRSEDGDQGFPGNMEVTAVYQLTEDGALQLCFEAVTDRVTPVSLTGHTYFNLAGQGDIGQHVLTLAADAFTPAGPGLIPTGELRPVAGTPFDFRRPHAIGERIAADDAQLRLGYGYDHNWVLDGSPVAARVQEPLSGRVLEVLTDAPGLQFYSGNFLDGRLSGKGRVYGRRSGFCLEPQQFPDAPNQPGFPDAMLRPGQRYRARITYRFSTQ